MKARIVRPGTARLHLLKFEPSQRRLAKRKRAALADLPPIVQKAMRLHAVSGVAAATVERMLDNLLLRLEEKYGPSGA
jgi:hypothetical protein